jgi:hypothetical protein
VPTEFLDGNTLRRIANLYTDKKSGSKPISDIEYRDSQCPGLCIKVRKRGATWCMLTREINAKIGDFHLFKAEDIPALRELVAEAKLQLKDGHKPDALFEAFRKQRDVATAREVHRPAYIQLMRSNDALLGFNRLCAMLEGVGKLPVIEVNDKGNLEMRFVTSSREQTKLMEAA